MNIFKFLFILGLAGCSNQENWVCHSGINANGDAIQYSTNIETGKIGAYSNCQQSNK